MGLASSQARILLLTAQKSDLEYRAQVINQRKLNLSNQTQALSERYSRAINNRKLTFALFGAENDVRRDLSYSDLRAENGNTGTYLITDKEGYGEGYRGLLVKGELFSVGDEVKMVGFDFIRFGGRVTGSYNFINPTPEENPKGMETESSPFPAYRGENQTIIYKYGWSYNGENGTGTNVYGYEAAVNEDGVVVELNVNVSTIPENGYVISGHGKGRDFIRSNIVLGATIELNEENKTYTISTTLNSYFENLVTSVESSISSVETKRRQLYDLDFTLIDGYINELNQKVSSLRTIKEEIETGLDSGSWNDKEKLSHLMVYNTYQLEIERINQKLISASVESKAVAAKSVWHRPTEQSYQEIDNNLKLYSDLGINLVFVETLYGGYSTFKSKYSNLFPYNPKLALNYSSGLKG